jgi:hypothetical protein
MSRLPHTYAHLDRDSSVSVQIPMRKLAEDVEHLNYGTHRFLSHLIDVRRALAASRVEELRQRGDHDVAAYALREGDPLVDGIEALLAKGLY